MTDDDSAGAISLKADDHGTSGLVVLPKEVVIEQRQRVEIKPVSRVSADSRLRGAIAESSVDELSIALDEQSDLPLLPRLSAVRSLGVGLARADWEIIRDFVRSNERIAALNPHQLRYLKNEAMASMIRADAWWDEAGDAFKEVFQDAKQDMAVRDYALQFIAVAAEKDPRVGWDVHWQTLQGGDKDFACTAALHLLAASARGELNKVEQVRLGASALDIASGSSLPAANRATALQVCAELSIRDAYNIADAMSRNESEALIVRLSAIATLGKLGGTTTSETHLRSLTSSSDKRVRSAASSALAQFKVRAD